jgi:tetratricopeptide (TPR) repeat protein
MFRPFAWIAAFLGVLATAAQPVVAASCKIEGLAQIPVTMRGTQPLIPAKINGKDVKFLLDSGAFYSVLSPAIAEALSLPQTLAPSGFVVRGVGGISHPTIATVREFGLAGAVVNNMEFLVVGGSHGEAVGVLGQNVLSFADVEYDFGGGAVRLMRAENCKDEARVYWMKPGEKFSSVAIQPIAKFESQVVGTAYLNGKKIRVIFDTGASMSILSLRAAQRAGVTTTSPGVVPSSAGRGLGLKAVSTWIAPFKSFRIGEEEIRDTQLRIGDIDLREADMLLGADFFLSHRIYVAYGANKVLFTYRGGPVFNLGTSSSPESIDAPGETLADTREPVDAQGYARRSAVLSARRDLPRALADINRAIEMAPNVADYHYQRATVQQQSRQSQAALEDLNHTISLQADHLQARVTRAGLLLSRLEATGNGSVADIQMDIDMAATAAAKEADVHFELGRLYAGIGVQDRAMTSFDQWLELHRADGRAADALAYACRARALLNQELPRALSDCNRAVQDRPGIPFPLESRGLLHVRMRNFDRAVTDLDKVVTAQPGNAWALYARGLAKLGKGLTKEGETDIAAARSVNPRAVSNAVLRGFVP